MLTFLPHTSVLKGTLAKPPKPEDLPRSASSKGASKGSSSKSPKSNALKKKEARVKTHTQTLLKKEEAFNVLNQARYDWEFSHGKASSHMDSKIASAAGKALAAHNKLDKSIQAYDDHVQTMHHKSAGRTHPSGEHIRNRVMNNYYSEKEDRPKHYPGSS